MSADNFSPENTPTNSDGRARKGLSAGTVIALILSAFALVLAAGTLWETRDASKEVQQIVGTKLGEQSTLLKESAVRTEQMNRDLKEAQTRVAQLEGKLAEFQGQRVALEEMYRELARAPDDWLLAEIEQTLNIASREITLAGNVRAAIIALQAADQRLSRADKLQVVQLRRAITQDLERLKAIPIVDTQGVSLKLDSLMGLVNTLPLSIPDMVSAGEREKLGVDDTGNAVGRFGKDLWSEVKQLVQIRRLDNADPALLTPQQSYFLRENLKLRLLSARTALIARDEANYKEDLKLARELLTKYFDPKAKVNTNALATLKQLAENPVSIAAPDITASLNAIRAARAARERPTR
jgi:uroporphyrin-III C-methyltransferase